MTKAKPSGPPAGYARFVRETFELVPPERKVEALRITSVAWVSRLRRMLRQSGGGGTGVFYHLQGSTAATPARRRPPASSSSAAVAANSAAAAADAAQAKYSY